MGGGVGLVRPRPRVPLGENQVGVEHPTVLRTGRRLIGDAFDSRAICRSTRDIRERRSLESLQRVSGYAIFSLLALRSGD